MARFSYRDDYSQTKLDYLAAMEEHKIPRVHVVLAWLSFITLAIWVAFAALVPWTQTVAGSGAIVALDPNDREQAISALVPGRISEWYVREGSIVAAGDPIARIVDNDPQLLTNLQSQIDLARDRLNNATAAAETAKLDLERKEKLLAEGLVSRLEFEQSRIRVAEREVTVQSAADSLNRAIVALSREGSQTVLAPRPGIITRVSSAGTSTFVKAGDQLARIAPSDVERTVEIYVDGLDANLISPGRETRLQFEGWPIIQFSGWPAVAVGTFRGQVRYVDPLAGSNGLFRVIIEEPEGANWPSDQALRLGTKAHGWVLLDDVLVGYELWRRANNFPPEFTDTPLDTSGGSGS